MRWGLIGALLLASPATAAPPARVTLEIPDLSRSAARIVELLQWGALGEPELSPTALGARLSSALGVDPLSVAALREVGVDPSKPVRVRLDGARRQIVLEASLRDPAKAQAHAAARARALGASPLLGGGGFVIGDEPSEAVALWIRDKTAVAVIGAGYRPPPASRTATTAGRPPPAVDPARDRRLATLRDTKRAGVRPPKALLDGPPVDAWVVIEPRDDVERIDLVLRGSGKTFVIGGELALGMGPEVVLAEGLRGRSKAARLVESGPVAVDLATTLTRAGLREALARIGVPSVWAAALAGPVHVGITADGTAFAAARLSPKADGPALTEALAKRVSGVDVRVVDGVAIARLGAQALGPAKAPAPASAALVMAVVPKHILGALDRHRSLLGIRPMALMMARLLVGRMVAATEGITVEASMPTNRLRFTATLRIGG